MIALLKPGRVAGRSAALLALTFWLPLTAVAAAGTESIQVQVRGAALQPGTYQLDAGSRLNNAAAAGQVRADAWFLGAALLRRSAMEDQTRLKAGLLFELETNRVHARSRNDDDLYSLLGRFNSTVESFPITGRVTAEMDPLAQLLIDNNDLLEHGDQLIYPTRANQVRVMGAVSEPCVLDHDPAMQLDDYLSACNRHSAADRDTAYLIQPDGHVSQHGVAYWNQEEADVAVGAVIYVPVQQRMLAPSSTGLNEDMAAMLATQYTLGGRFDE